jgi:broad specificity phosphatase PhoE
LEIPKRKFIFVRHGQTDWNIDDRLQGLIDVPLNATGLDQAQAICKKLLAEHVDVIVSSPLIRALKTASFIAETHQRPIHIDSRLTERNFGAWEGRLGADVRRELGLTTHQPLSEHLDHVAESWPGVTGRTLAVVTDWLHSHPRKKLVFVSHGALFRALAEILAGKVIRADNAQPYLFTPTKKSWDIEPL